MFTSTDGIVHILLVAFSGLVLVISLFAYADRRSPRYLFLALAFTFLARLSFGSTDSSGRDARIMEQVENVGEGDLNERLVNELWHRIRSNRMFSRCTIGPFT